MSKFPNKRSTSVINANKANEKLKEINNLKWLKHQIKRLLLKVIKK